MFTAMNLADLKDKVRISAALGAAELAKRLKPADDLVSARTAYAMFGKPVIEEWVKRGLCSPRRSGPHKNSKLLFSVSELQSVRAAEEINIISLKNQKYFALYNSITQNK